MEIPHVYEELLRRHDPVTYLERSDLVEKYFEDFGHRTNGTTTGVRRPRDDSVNPMYMVRPLLGYEDLLHINAARKKPRKNRTCACCLAKNCPNKNSCKGRGAQRFCRCCYEPDTSKDGSSGSSSVSESVGARSEDNLNFNGDED